MTLWSHISNLIREKWTYPARWSWQPMARPNQMAWIIGHHPKEVQEYPKCSPKWQTHSIIRGSQNTVSRSDRWNNHWHIPWWQVPYQCWYYDSPKMNSTKTCSNSSTSTVQSWIKQNACHKTGHFTSCCFHRGKQDKYHKNKPNDVHGITTQDGENESNTLPVESDQESTSSNESFFVGTITAVNKVTAHDNTIFLIDLPITTKVHHKHRQMLHLKADSGAMKNVMTKQLYVSLTGDKFFNELGPPECLLKGYGEKTQICNLGTHKFFLWHGRWPYEVTFQISSEKNEPTLLGGADSLWLGLIKWLGSLDTTQKKSKNTQNAPQNDKLIQSLEDLKTQYPDLIDETTIGTFPGDKYHINVDTTIPPKWTAPRPVPIHQQAQFKAELNKMLAIKQDTLPAAASTEANKTNTIKTSQMMSMALPLKMVKMRATPCQWKVTKNPLPAMKVSL